MGLVTLEIGPTWKMEFLRDVLAEHGVQAFVLDSNTKQIDPMITGALSFDARLEVAEEGLERAREALEVARADGAALLPQGEQEKAEADATLAKLEDLGRRIRWGTVLFWMHPFVFLYGWRYLGLLARTARRPAGHGLTLAALTLVSIVWCILAVALTRRLQSGF